MANIKEMLANMNTRQKATIGVFTVVVLVIIWQLFGLISGGETTVAAEAEAQAAQKSAMPTPKSVPVQTANINQQSPEEQERERQQKESQVRYIAALNELQMLKVAQQLVETNEKIMKSKEGTVSAQKKIVDMLTMVETTSATPGMQNVQGGVAGQAGQSDQNVATVATAATATYTVVSVSQTQGKWNAILKLGTNLYSVHSGDVLPADETKVISIDKSGVVIEQDGVRKKISMVPII